MKKVKQKGNGIMLKIVFIFMDEVRLGFGGGDRFKKSVLWRFLDGG